MATTLAPIGTNGMNPTEAHEETAKAMMAGVDRMRKATMDAVIDTRAIEVQFAQGDNLKPTERLLLSCKTPQGSVPVMLMEGAHDQLANTLDIHRAFYDRLLRDHPDMLAYNIQQLMQREPKKRMLRMLNPEHLPELQEATGRTHSRFAVRAIVSDGYRPLDNAGLVDTLMPAAARHGLKLVQYNLDERRFNLRFAGPERTIGDIRRAHGFADDHTGTYHLTGADGKDRAWVNEVLSFGVAVGNSETGHGSLSVQEFSRVLRCLNAYVKDEVSRTRHAGKRQDETDGIVSATTRRLENAHIFARVRDNFIAAVGDQKQKLLANKFAEAMGQPVVIPDEMRLFEFVDVIGKRFELTEDERELLQEEVNHEMVEAQVRTPSRFTIAQGFTAMAKKAPAFARRQEIETIGWQIVEDPTSLLVKAAERAAGKK